MTAWLAEQLEHYFDFPAEPTQRILKRVLVVLAAILFVLIATLIVAFDDVFPNFNTIANLQVGDVAPRAITAPEAMFISQLLTEEARQKARDAVQPVYDPPDPNVARQQTGLAQQILNFMQNVRRDTFATLDDKIHDLNHITALTLSETIARAILQMDEETWLAVQDEILNVLPRVLRESIRPNDLQSMRDQMPTQVSIRFNAAERDVIVAIIEDLIRPNTFENVEATETARQAAADGVQPVSRRFLRGENVIDGGSIITPADYEALQALGVLRSEDLRLQEILRAGLASLVVLTILGLYMTRFEMQLIYRDTRLLTLLAVIFLVMLAGLRFFGIGGNVYLFPTAALALIYVTVVSPHLAMLAAVCLAVLVGIMSDNSLEMATLIAAGSIIGTLTLRRADRLNAFFVAGVLIGVVNGAVVTIFLLSTPLNTDDPESALRVLLAIFSGVLMTPATAIAVMYVMTAVFNLTTALKLMDLSQSNKPLLQRLLREAPGTYQHSLQVANLAEQAAIAIGADAQLTHVAALYHDIGKMLNPLYFTENQQGIGNPHDILNDPYRSADIIISHVTEGDELAKQYGLPQRIRDFIREHHGTTKVFVFYQRALNNADGNAAAVDIEDFTYPGPRPHSRETAILMLADSCEATVRAAQLKGKQDIADIVATILDDKRKDGQLDKSGLTFNDLRTIQTAFVDVLQGMFHPRLNYQEAVARKQGLSETVIHVSTPIPTPIRPKSEPKPLNAISSSMERIPEIVSTGFKPETKPAPSPIEAATALHNSIKRATITQPAVYEEEPMTEVPPLPRADEKRLTAQHPLIKSNGTDSNEMPRIEPPTSTESPKQP